MISRERVLASLRHEEPDRVPIDLDGMGATSITAIAYSRLTRHLGMVDHIPTMYDIEQQIVHPSSKLLEHFRVDIRPLNLPANFNLPQETLSQNSEGWKVWLTPDGSQVQVPKSFSPIVDENGNQFTLDEAGEPLLKMPAEGYYFYRVQHPLANATTIAEIEAYPFKLLSDEELDELRRVAFNIYETTDKAIIGEFRGSITEAAQSLRGWDRFLMDLYMEPKLIQALMERLMEIHITNLEKYLSAVGEYIQIINMGDDLGTQKGPMISPDLYRRMVKPYHKSIYQYAKNHSDLFVFMHCCGSIVELIPDLIDAGVDIINPVQISAVSMEPVNLKREFGKDLVFWGGGCDSQTVLPHSSPEQVRKNVGELIDIFAPGGGYVFAPIHNIQVDVPAENIIAMYEAALEYGNY